MLNLVHVNQKKWGVISNEVIHYHYINNAGFLMSGPQAHLQKSLSPEHHLCGYFAWLYCL